MSRPTRVQLSAAALRHNLARVRSYAPASRVMAVVKANGYGHGLEWAAQVLSGADAFGVTSLDEAIALRRAGVTRPVCLLEGAFRREELAEIAAHRLAAVVHHDRQVEQLERLSGGTPVDVWLKIDTGMHRIGFDSGRAGEAFRRLRACRGVGSLGLLSHFARADNPLDDATVLQIRQFQAFAAAVGGERSIANSAGIVAWPESRMEWVRPGIMLYGASPVIGQPAGAYGLEPVMTLHSEVIAVNRWRRGDAIGYGGDWRCPEDMPVGVVAIGYGDGYPRHAPSGTPVLVNGRRVPLIGRVSMDMITVDLRTQPDTRVGDPAVLWGRGLPVEEIAAHAGTISYELLCHVAPRVMRVAPPEG